MWDVRTGRFDGGWTVEMAIPFKSLRYRSGPTRSGASSFAASIRRKNEWTHLTPVPAAAGVPGGHVPALAGGTLVGLDLPPAEQEHRAQAVRDLALTTDRSRTTGRLDNDSATGDRGRRRASTASRPI